jgi:RNA polymerase sigma-70 factor (ECF subfamily)
VPQRPAAWLTTAARRRALDRLRHAAIRREKAADLLRAEQLRLEERVAELENMGDPCDQIPDERLRLVFTCCHPALARDAQVALALRTLGGLSPAEVARAFLIPEATLAKRLVRAKRKIRDARIPYQGPPPDQWAERLAAVLAVVYLIFNQGYTASAADGSARVALCREAIRLARVLAELLPEEPEVWGLLALALLHDARSAARTDAQGEMVPLEAQDPRRWDAGKLAQGRDALATAARLGRPGPYQVQAAISAAHVDASLRGLSEQQRWAEVERLYAQLEALLPTPVVRLNRAVATGRARGPAAGLALLETLACDADAARQLADYQPWHATRADLLRRAGRSAEARAAAYLRALELTEAEPERRFLSRRLGQVRG